MGETHEIPHHNLADFEPWIGHATEGQAVGSIPFENTLEGPQFRPQPQPLHFAVGRAPPAMAEKGKLDHIEESLKDIEGGEDYAFASLEELFLVPKHDHSQVQGVGLWQVQGDYLPQEPSKDVLSEDGGIRKRWGTADTFLPRKSYWGSCYLVH